MYSKLIGINTLSCNEGSMRLRPESPLGEKEFLVLMDQYKKEIFSCVLRLLPLCSSTFHQTNVGFCHSGSEDNLLISRIQSLHLLLEVDYHDEEECPIASTLDNPWTNNLVVQYRSKFFLNEYSFCG